MMCPLHAVAIVIILAAGGVGNGAQSSSGAPRSKVALEEAKQLDEQIRKLFEEGKFAAAMAPAERALMLREKALGPGHPLVAESLNHLAALYSEQGAYTKAEPLYTRALAIRENALESSQLLVAESLNHLATLYYKQGAYTKAEPLYIRALSIREKALGP